MEVSFSHVYGRLHVVLLSYYGMERENFLGEFSVCVSRTAAGHCLMTKSPWALAVLGDFGFFMWGFHFSMVTRVTMVF